MLRDLPKCTAKWVIAVTATYKSPTNKYTTRDGKAGRVFNVTFKDSSATVKAAFFEEVFDKFHHRIIVGEVYS